MKPLGAQGPWEVTTGGMAPSLASCGQGVTPTSEERVTAFTKNIR